MKDLIIIGAGGFGREIAWLTDRINKAAPLSPLWNLLGFIDDNEQIQGQRINGYPVLGNMSAIKRFPNAYFVCAVGTSCVREKIIKKAKKQFPGIHFATLIDPSAVMSDLVTVGEGTMICAHTIITVNITIGEHVILNLDCTVGHDAILQDFCTLYPSVNVSGITNIGRGAELGTGMQIIQGKTIGDYSIIGAGSVVVKDIPANCTAVGSPAKPVRFHNIPKEM